MYCTSTQQNGLGASLATSVLFLLAKSAVSRARRGSVCLPCVPSLQIYLPYDILGIFIPFVFNQKKKFMYVLDPHPILTWGMHIFKNMEIGKKINLALQLANPKWNDDISKWERKVLIVPTNLHG